MRHAQPKAGGHAGRRRAAWALVAAGALVFALEAAARAGTIFVDVNGGGDFLTLAEAFAAAASGDTVIVAPGVYSGDGNRDLEITDKALTIASSDGAESTVIELEGHTGIEISGTGTTPSVITGLTFQHGDLTVSCDATSVTVSDCVFLDNALTVPPWTGTAFRGLSCVSIYVKRCRFAGNWLGLQVADSFTSVTSCSFEGNGVSNLTGAWGAGAVRLSGETAALVFIEGCSFTGNRGASQGGAMQMRPNHTTVRDCTFEDNWAARDGGAICIDYSWGDTSARTKIIGCTFSSNGAQDRGGAIHTIKARFEVSDCTFDGNTAPQGGAASVYRKATAYPVFTRCAFMKNSAEMGAGVFCDDSAPIIQDCLFLENDALLWAGGVCGVATEEAPGALIKRCTFVRNTAHRGAAVVADQAPSTIESCTFYGDAADDAVIACLRSSEMVVSKSAIAFSGRGAPLVCQFGSLEVYHTVIHGNASGDSLSCYQCVSHPHDNIFVDPLFCDVAADDLTLCANSPCLPGGNPWGLLTGAHDAGCGDCGSAVVPTSWGMIKALYRTHR